MEKDRTNLHASGILQQNIANLYKNAQILTHNTSYPSWTVESDAEELENYIVNTSEEILGNIIMYNNVISMNMIKKTNDSTITPSNNYLFNEKTHCKNTISGFSMCQYIKKHKLEDHMNFQQMLSANLAFVAYATLSLNTSL